MQSKRGDAEVAEEGAEKKRGEWIVDRHGCEIFNPQSSISYLLSDRDTCAIAG